MEDIKHNNKEDNVKDLVEHSYCMVLQNSNQADLMKTVLMTICNLFHADGATPVGNMFKLTQPRLNFLIVLTEWTALVLITQKWRDLIEATTETICSTLKIMVSKHPMAVSSTLQSKLPISGAIMLQRIIIIICFWFNFNFILFYSLNEMKGWK